MKSTFKKIKFEWIFYLVFVLCLIIGVIADARSWIVVASATSIPLLFVVLILSYVKNDMDSIKASIVWGVLGFAMLLLAVYSDKKYVNENITSVITNVSGTLISLAVIGVIFQLKDTKEYFASTLSDLIMKESYVAKLSRPQLERLQKTVLERYFENSSDLNRENSFYGFFRDNLQNFIGSPYRENYRNTISISEESTSNDVLKNNFLVEDKLTYQIRSMGNDLQKEIRWAATKDEIKKLHEFTVKINDIKIFEWPSSDQQDEVDLVEHNFSANPESGVNLCVRVYEMANKIESIRDQYQDGAIVKITAKYSVTNYNSITTKLLFPTKGFSLTVMHYPGLKTKVEAYGFDSNSKICEHNETNGGFTFNYPDWLLPHSGVYVALENSSTN